MSSFEEIIDAKLKILMADYYEFEQIISELPLKTKSEIENVIQEISAIEKALKSVPEQFDIDFSRKINRILDVVSEVELHTKKLNNTIQSDNSAQIAKQAELLAHEFNKNIDGYSITSLAVLVIWGIVCAMSGGIIASFLVLAVFPKIF